MACGVGGDGCAHGEAEQEDGCVAGDDLSQGCVGGVGVAMEVVGCDGSGTLAVAGVMEDKGGDSMLGEEGLDGLPVGELFADSVEDKDCGDGRIPGLQGGGFEGLVLAVNH